MRQTGPADLQPIVDFDAVESAEVGQDGTTKQQRAGADDVPEGVEVLELGIVDAEGVADPRERGEPSDVREREVIGKPQGFELADP